MPRSKSPARPKAKTPTKTVAVKKAGGAFDLSFITNDERSRNPFGNALIATAVAYGIYSLDLMGFLVTDQNFMPA
jgi:hypothetical protein